MAQKIGSITLIHSRERLRHRTPEWTGVLPSPWARETQPMSVSGIWKMSQFSRETVLDWPFANLSDCRLLPDPVLLSAKNWHVTGPGGCPCPAIGRRHFRRLAQFYPNSSFITSFSGMATKKELPPEGGGPPWAGGLHSPSVGIVPRDPRGPVQRRGDRKARDRGGGLGRWVGAKSLFTCHL